MKVKPFGKRVAQEVEHGVQYYVKPHEDGLLFQMVGKHAVDSLAVVVRPLARGECKR